MNARSAARELALLALFQMEKQGELPVESFSAEKTTLQELILSAVRTLTDQAQEQIESSATELGRVRESLEVYQQDHAINLETPLDADILPVPLPNSKEMLEKVEKCMLAMEYLAEALRIPEFAALARTESVHSFALQLLQLTIANQKDVDSLINHYSQDWKIERLVKTDREILRLAVTEMKYVHNIDLSVTINEAVELAKKFSTEESYKFINGLLGRIAEVLEAEMQQSTQAL